MNKEWIKADKDKPPEYDKFYLACWGCGNYSIVYFWACSWKYVMNMLNSNGESVKYYIKIEPPEK